MPKISLLDATFSQGEQEKLARFLRDNPRLSVDGFRDLLSEKGLDVARSTAHEYKDKLEALGKRMRDSRIMAEQLVRSLDEAAVEGQYGRALVEMARTLVFEYQEKVLNGRGEELTPQEFFFLGKALKEMAQAARLDQEFEIRIADRVAKETRQKAIEAVESVTKDEKGLSRQTVEAIKAKILGVEPPAAAP